MSYSCSWTVTLIILNFGQKKKMDTGKLIKELRLKKGMTQEELAAKTEVSSRTIQRIENGEVDPRAYTLAGSCRTYSMAIQELNKTSASPSF